MKITNTLVLGIGNTLLTDEGVGVHVINRLARDYPNMPQVTFLDGGTLSFTLAGEVASHNRLIVVDAVRTGSPPGSVVCYQGTEMERYLRGSRKSVHEVGLADLLDMTRLTEQYPGRTALVGIEPFEIGWGEQLSPVVAQALPSAAAGVMALIDEWDRGSDPA